MDQEKIMKNLAKVARQKEELEALFKETEQ